jgi:hypothetical protein
MHSPVNRKELRAADPEGRKREMREKITIAAVATIVIVVNSVIVANWSHVRQAPKHARPLSWAYMPLAFFTSLALGSAAGQLMCND